MTNERAIELLKRISDSQFDGIHGDERREALSMAVMALEPNLVKESGDLVKDLVKDCISRQQAIDALDKHIDTFDAIDKNYLSGLRTAMSILKEMPSAQPEIIHCGDCKYFELDHFEKVDEFPIPIIVAHEICMKWSGGCRTSIDGWCFMAERRTDETD